MEKVRVNIPRRGHETWLLVTSVPPGSFSHTIQQWVGRWLHPGRQERIPVGSVIARRKMAHMNKHVLEILIQLPDGQRYEGRQAIGQYDAPAILREYVRGWLLLSPECRVIRACGEWADRIQARIDEMEDQESSSVIAEPSYMDSPAFQDKLGLIDQLDRMSAQAALAPDTVTEASLLQAFERWLEATATISSMTPERICALLNHAVQRHADCTDKQTGTYLKRFTRALRLKAKEKE